MYQAKSPKGFDWSINPSRDPIALGFPPAQDVLAIPNRVGICDLESNFIYACAVWDRLVCSPAILWRSYDLGPHRSFDVALEVSISFTIPSLLLPYS
jgi:hypothetical protein